MGERMRNNRIQLIRAMRTLNRIDGQYAQMRRAIGVKESLFVLLYACADGELRSQKEICEEWYLPRSTLNTVVKEQVKAGNVELVPRGDKQKDVRLTEAGYALAERLIGSLLDAEEDVARTCISDGLARDLEAFADGLEEAFGSRNLKN